MVLTRHVQSVVAVSENGREHKYTCYGDHENKDKFYVLPETPEYSIDPKTNGPKFVMYTYRGDAVSNEEGGFTVFSVKLPFPGKGSSLYNKVKQELISDVGDRLKVRAEKTLALVKQYGNTPEGWEKVRQTLGYTQSQIDTFRNGYDPAKGSGQFFLVPEDSKVELAAVPFTAAKAELTIANASESFFEKRVSPATPSMIGDNETVFAISLTGQGAAFFQQALWGGEGGSIAGVKYTFSAESLLPPVTVKVKYDAEATKEFSRDIDRNVWGQAKEEKIREEYSQTNTSAVEVNFLSREGMEPKQADDLEKELREWGQQQLEDIINNQTGGVDLNADIGQRFKKNPDKVKETLSNTKDVERTFRLVRPVEFGMYPQTVLPSIKTLVGESKKADYFPEIDLNAEFFKKLTARIQVNTDFEKFGIFSVNVKLKHGDDTPQTFIFNAQNRGETKEQVWYKDGDDAFSYSYVVSYENESETFESALETGEGFDVVNIGVGNTGILQVDIKQGDIDWLLVKRAQVMFRYPDASVEDQRTLTELVDTAEPFIKPIFKPRDKPIEYRTKFFLKDGKELLYALSEEGNPVEWATSGDSTIYIDDPFGGTQPFTLLATGLDRKTEAIVATLTYKLPSIEYTATKTVTFSDAHRNEEWKVPLATGEVGEMSYTGFIQFSDGTTRDISNAKVEGTIVKIGVEKKGVMEVNVNAEDIDFENRFKSAKVYLHYVDSENSISEKESFSFRDEDEEDWSVDLKDPQHKEYKYQVALSHREKGFGERGKIYLPGPTKNDWETTEGALILSDIIPDDATFAKVSNLVLINVVKDTIDWDEVKQVKLKVLYGEEKKTFRLDEDDEDEPNPVFLAPKVDGVAVHWQAEFRMDDGEKFYYPEDKDELIELDEAEIFINDYISDEYGGNRSE